MEMQGQFDRRGKRNMSKYTYRKGKESRMIYMTGYIEGQLQHSQHGVVSRSWYRDRYNLSKSTLYKDIKGLSAAYPGLVWIK